DLSPGGIFIRTREPLAVGTTLNFDFSLQSGTPMLKGDGVVVWIREPDPARSIASGMGIRFDKLLGDSQNTLAKLLAEKTRREKSHGPTAARQTMHVMETVRSAAAPTARAAVPVAVPPEKTPVPDGG